jgi:hypothetical protein
MQHQIQIITNLRQSLIPVIPFQEVNMLLLLKHYVF